eukprot:PhF_6_TR16950/c1_g1_i2/m.25565
MSSIRDVAYTMTTSLRLEQEPSVGDPVLTPRQTAEELLLFWEEIFGKNFLPDTARKYAKSFSIHMIDGTEPRPLNDYNFHELDIPIGHRHLIEEIIASVHSSHRNDTLLQSFQDPQSPSHARETLRGEMESLKDGSVHELLCGFQWVDYEGMTASFDGFLSFVRKHFLSRGTPDELPEEFLRAFMNNKPMSFVLKGHSKKGNPASLLLLRLPSPELLDNPVNVTENTVATMTNRLVVIFLPRGNSKGQLITYHKDPGNCIPWLDHMKSPGMWDMLKQGSRDDLVTEIIARAVEAHRSIMHSLRRQLDCLSELPITTSPSEVVGWLSKLSKQAQVIRRVLQSNGRSLDTFTEMLHLDVGAVLSSLEDITMIAEEVETHAMDTINLKIGLIGFQGQENMKLFTQISAVTAPLTVLTGWYGMNFEFMPELHFEESYYVMVAATLMVCVLMSLLVKYKHREKMEKLRDHRLVNIAAVEAETFRAEHQSEVERLQHGSASQNKGQSMGSSPTKYAWIKGAKKVMASSKLWRSKRMDHDTVVPV